MNSRKRCANETLGRKDSEQACFYRVLRAIHQLTRQAPGRGNCSGLPVNWAILSNFKEFFAVVDGQATGASARLPERKGHC